MTRYNKSFVANELFIHFAVKNGAPKCLCQMIVKGRLVREFDIELATGGDADWWAFYDLTPFKGEQVLLTIDGDHLAETTELTLEDCIRFGENLQHAEDLYKEKYRPQFHFTPRRGWNNDPNGMVFAGGIWHLYYQYNPFGVGWGNMHWGHAISHDLMYWQEQPIALYSRSLQDMAFSGGAVVDVNDTAGFRKGFHESGKHPIVLSFTSTGRGECLAYSLDGGRTHHEYEGNPVLNHQGRDPKIICYEPGKKWVMIVYEEVGEERGYALYDSHDLKLWRRFQFLPGFYECPELFSLKIDGDPQKEKWVIYGSTGQQYPSAYMIGNFDGSRFTPEMEPAPAHFGPHFYAAQIFNHAPDGRRIMMAWLAGAAYPEMPFSQGLTVPLELTLRSLPGGVRLCFEPVSELATLYRFTSGLQSITISQANEFLAGWNDELMDIKLGVIPGTSQAVTLHVRGYPITFHSGEQTIECFGKKAPVSLVEGKLILRVLLDRSVMEVFAGQGEAAFAGMAIPAVNDVGIYLAGEGTVDRLTLHSLNSIWQ